MRKHVIQTGTVAIKQIQRQGRTFSSVQMNCWNSLG
jgi:hypothetical protein